MRNDSLVFADTSALLALLDGDDLNRTAALDEWKEFSESGTKLFTSDYVRLESCSLIQRRLGVAALCDYRDGFLPLMPITLVGEQGFELAFEKWRLARSKQLSLVDIPSFDCMNRMGISGPIRLISILRSKVFSFAQVGPNLPRDSSRKPLELRAGRHKRGGSEDVPV